MQKICFVVTLFCEKIASSIAFYHATHPAFTRTSAKFIRQINFCHFLPFTIRTNILQEQTIFYCLQEETVA